MKLLKHPLLVLFIVMFSQSVGAQNYIRYQQIFNRLDEDVLSDKFPSGNFENVIRRLDTVQSEYDFIYGKHCFKALQICITLHDSIRANWWLAKCFRQGIPLWMIRANRLTAKSLEYSITQKTVQDYPQLRQIYVQSIDTTLSKSIDSLLEIDQKYTRKVNDGFVLFKPVYWLFWGMNNRRLYRQFRTLVFQFGYPEERLIGLPSIQDSARFAPYFGFWGPSEIRDSRVQIMFQHCFSTWHKIDVEFRDSLRRNLECGNIPAFQYALLVDFMYPDTKKYPEYEYWSTRIFSATTVNQNRISAGLNSLEQEKRNNSIEINRRKSKTAQSEIMLE